MMQALTDLYFRTFLLEEMCSAISFLQRLHCLVFSLLWCSQSLLFDALQVATVP